MRDDRKRRMPSKNFHSSIDKKKCINTEQDQVSD